MMSAKNHHHSSNLIENIEKNDRGPAIAGACQQQLGGYGGPAVVMRNLARNTSKEELKGMLLFTKDLLNVDFIPSSPEHSSHSLTAIAHFQNAAAAHEAETVLNGLKDASGQATMFVEAINLPLSTITSAALPRRNTVDNALSGTGGHLRSPQSARQPALQSIRSLAGAFQSLELTSSSPLPNKVQESVDQDNSLAEAHAHLPSMFSPQPLGAMANPERSRVTGKQVINQDNNDDDTRELLKDPVAYMNNDRPTAMSHHQRRSTNPQQASGPRFSTLPLNTDITSPTGQEFASPLSSNVSVYSPSSARSPSIGLARGAPNLGFLAGQQQYQRHNYPPVNPADQNPPCNTLYVGNLPIDTSEDELKAMFSKQRGYKRLCFRTKQNGPMCFVEFEDVSFATKALNELYGVQLHNSIKGGIRLSFSKNPLGVRTGQHGSANPITPLALPSTMTPPGSFTGPLSPGSNMSNNQVPPPGLSAPPGLGIPGSTLSSTMNGVPVAETTGGGAGASMFDRQSIPAIRGPPLGATSGSPGVGSRYPDYMMGR